MLDSKYMNPGKMLSDNLSNLHMNHLVMSPRSFLGSEEREEVEQKSQELFSEIHKGNLDFVVNVLAAHIVTLDNISNVCHKKASKGEHFRELTELSIKSTGELRKSASTLAQIKNIVVNIQNLSIQQNNLIQLEAAKQLSNEHTSKKVQHDKTKTVVSAE